MGAENAVGLKNGTSGWVLAGYDLETGADRVELPQVSPDGLAAAEAYAERVAAEDGVLFLNVEELQEKMARRTEDNVYLIDVRTREEYEAGHISGFSWFPGGQVAQRSDDVAVVKNSPIVFACDGQARGTLVASWYRQMGMEEELITTIPVKSIVTHPNDATQTLSRGTHVVRGYAWSGDGVITQVEVSVDGGKTWQAARRWRSREPPGGCGSGGRFPGRPTSRESTK